MLSCHLLVDRRCGLFPSGFPTKMLYASLMCATCLDHFIILHLINPLMFDYKYKLCSSSLCNCLHPLLLPTSQFQIFSSAAYSQIPSIHVLHLGPGTKFNTHKKNSTVIVMYINIYIFDRR
jgi:hypothetical protein